MPSIEEKVSLTVVCVVANARVDGICSVIDRLCQPILNARLLPLIGITYNITLNFVCSILYSTPPSKYISPCI